MKKILLTLAVAFSLSALSVEGSAQEKRIMYYSTEVMDEINATAAQREAVTELVAKYRVLFNRAKANSSSAEESKAELKRLSGERAKEYWKILTPEQVKYLKDKAKAK